jgi:dTDP-4-amino-4,6-dideoxygalactose transaminase
MKKLNYARHFIDSSDIEAVVNVLHSDFLTQGPIVKNFEDAVAEYVGSRYAVAVSNGTIALDLAIKSLNITPNKTNGITTANTFLASANSMLYNNIQPKFSDLAINQGNCDAEEFCSHIDDNTSLLLPVHFAGIPIDMAKIKAFSKGSPIVEDAAHALGSTYKCGTKIGSCKYSDMTIFSFHPVKNITAGEGGMITTNCPKLYNKLTLLRTHGVTREAENFENTSLAWDGDNLNPWYYEMQVLGYNSRLSDIHAALGISQLAKIEAFYNRKDQIRSIYDKAFEKIANIKFQKRESDYEMLHLYVVLIDFKKINKSRQKLMSYLKSRQIYTQVHYIPIYKQPFYQKLMGNDFELINTEEYYSQALSLPFYYGLENDEINLVVSHIKKFLKD